MVKQLNLKFQGRDVPAIFNLNTYINFGKAIGLTKVADLERVINEMFTGATGMDDVTFDQLYNFALFLLYGLKEGARKSGKAFDATVEDIFDAFQDDDELVEKMISEIIRNRSEADQGEADVSDTGEEEKKKTTP